MVATVEHQDARVYRGRRPGWHPSQVAILAADAASWWSVRPKAYPIEHGTSAARSNPPASPTALHAAPEDCTSRLPVALSSVSTFYIFELRIIVKHIYTRVGILQATAIHPPCRIHGHSWPDTSGWKGPPGWGLISTVSHRRGGGGGGYLSSRAGVGLTGGVAG